MNILYLLDNPQLYGSEMHLFDVLTYMGKKNTVFLITFRHGPLIQKIKELENIQICLIPSGYVVTKKVLKDLVNIIHTKQIQVIHAHQPKAIFIGTFIKKKCNIPLVSTVHSQPIDHALVCKGFRKIIVYWFHSFISYWGQRNSDKNIFVSRVMLSNAKFPNKSVLIYNWLRPSIRQTAPAAKYLQNNKKITFICCGSVTYNKGFDVLLDFVQKLMFANIHNFEVKVAGGVDKDFWMYLQKSYPSEIFNRIIVLGYIEDISSVYDGADFFVLFSRAETFGLACIEGMSFGLPVIASDLPVFHEIIPQENCISNNLEDAVNFVYRLLNNEIEYNFVSKINKNWTSRNFSFHKSMRQLEVVYKELVCNANKTQCL